MTRRIAVTNEMNAMQKAFQECIESDEFKESLAIDKIFESPESALWSIFVAGWDAANKSDSCPDCYGTGSHWSNNIESVCKRCKGTGKK